MSRASAAALVFCVVLPQIRGPCQSRVSAAALVFCVVLPQIREAGLSEVNRSAATHQHHQRCRRSNTRARTCVCAPLHARGSGTDWPCTDKGDRSGAELKSGVLPHRNAPIAIPARPVMRNGRDARACPRHMACTRPLARPPYAQHPPPALPDPHLAQHSPSFASLSGRSQGELSNEVR